MVHGTNVRRHNMVKKISEYNFIEIIIRGRLFDIFVLIFCNSTAGRLIYAYSHYNMCAGGGYMYQISNEKFGLFVTELRKEKNLTQKDLAEKLYVSDKTVSKWERGVSQTKRY